MECMEHGFILMVFGNVL